MTPVDRLAPLQAWREAGWLQPLDLAFARWLHTLDPAAPASLLGAAALLAQLEGRGHAGLPLDALQRDPMALLGWPAEAAPGVQAFVATLPGHAAAARVAWAGSSLLEVDPADDRGATPLVLAGALLSLRRYWRHEGRVAAQLRARSAVDARAMADAALPGRTRALLDALFDPRPDGDPGPDAQKIACALALRSRYTLITGGPGTGKTHTAARLLVLLQALHAGATPLRVALAAPTGKAAARLRQSIDTALHRLAATSGQALPPGDWAAHLGPARTLHALLGARPGTRRFAHDASHPLEVDLLFVDEASMVHLEMMDALLDALPADARLVLLGDEDQLASVEAGAVLADLCDGSDAEPHAYDADTVRWLEAATGEALGPGAPAAGPLAQQTARLRKSQRFGAGIGALARAVNRGDGAAASALLQADGEIAMRTTSDPQTVTTLALAGRDGPEGAERHDGHRPYLEAMARRPADPAGFDGWAREVLRRFEGFRVLCALREGPWGVSELNVAIERALATRGLLSRRGEWYEGRPVMITRNDASLGVFNGDIGVVLRPAGGGPLRVWFLDGEGLRSVSVTRLAEVETAFAMTVHKSQGSEFAHVVLVLPDADAALLTRELVYTGITRARRALTLVTPDAQRLAAACARRTQRISGLRSRLAGRGGGAGPA